MTLKTASLLAFIGTVLVTATLIWNLVFSVVNVLQGLLPAVVLFPAIIYAFASLSVAVFFFVFQKTQSR
jgi:predicted Co/Zn/Cd cation transporter (cation efflux family)